MTSDASGRDHGGRLDQAIDRFGGAREAWIDLSTGINPMPYPTGAVPAAAWAELPDRAANDRLIAAARRAWSVPDGAALLPVPGASIAIAQVPRLAGPGTFAIREPTYNEHAAAFRAAGWRPCADDAPDARILVHPNNPDGTRHGPAEADAPLTIIDESFCDTDPDASLVHLAARPGILILKSFGKFWGLAGLRLGFVIGDPDLIGHLAARIGPWPVSGPALAIGASALKDGEWARSTRDRLTRDAARLDRAVTATRATLTGGTTLFRLYDHPRAQDLHDHLMRRHILTRLFPWSRTAIRFGLPAPDQWTRLTTALQDFA
ncbi:threonine-phosphate decarboxylase [Pseudooceanicola batsensis]|nr:threonine-phosphate decarboxylase [Pseudooceanicola batsensis]